MAANYQTTFSNAWIPIKISLKFVPKSPINNIPALVQIMAWRRLGDKPLSEPMLVRLPTHICVTRPQWVKLPQPIVDAVASPCSDSDETIVGSFTKKINPRLVKCPLIFNGRIANLEVTSFVKEATGVCGEINKIPIYWNDFLRVIEITNIGDCLIGNLISDPFRFRFFIISIIAAVVVIMTMICGGIARSGGYWKSAQWWFTLQSFLQKAFVRSVESHLYLAGVIAAKLRWRLPNVNVIFEK